MLVGVDRFSLIMRQHGDLRVLHNCYIDSVGLKINHKLEKWSCYFKSIARQQRHCRTI